VQNDDCVTEQTNDRGPKWVRNVSVAVSTFHDPRAGLSIHDAFERASADLSDRTQFLALVSDYLRIHPELIQQWAVFSDDTRATPWPYFSPERFEVGFVSANGAIEDVVRWENSSDACADYLYRAINWVLRRER
jgi:hypothetical protein